jgi:hypothetical protein
MVSISAPVVLGQHPPHRVSIQFDPKVLGQLLSDLGQPKCGFRRFNSRMASISWGSGPFGPGLRLVPAEE